MGRRLGVGPVFATEWLTTSRRWQSYAGRVVFAGVLLLGLASVWVSRVAPAMAPIQAREAREARHPPTRRLEARGSQTPADSGSQTPADSGSQTPADSPTGEARHPPDSDGKQRKPDTRRLAELGKPDTRRLADWKPDTRRLADRKPDTRRLADWGSQTPADSPTGSQTPADSPTGEARHPPTRRLGTP